MQGSTQLILLESSYILINHSYDVFEAYYFSLKNFTALQLLTYHQLLVINVFVSDLILFHNIFHIVISTGLLITNNFQMLIVVLNHELIIIIVTFNVLLLTFFFFFK